MNNKENEILNQPNMANSESVQPVVNPVPVSEPVQPVVNPVSSVEPVQPVVNPVPVSEPVQPAVNPVPVAEPVQPVVNPVPPVEPVQPVVNSVPLIEPVRPIMNNVNPGMMNSQPMYNIPPQQTMMNNVTSRPNSFTKDNKNLLMIIGGVVGIIILAVIIFSFAGKKTLSCTMSEDMSGITMNSDAKVVYRFNKVNEVSLRMEFELGDEYADYKDMMFESLEERYESEFEEIEQEGGKASLTTKDNSIVLEMSASENNMDTLFSVDDEDSSYEAVKKELEDMGFTCK